jgi:PKD domain
VRVRTLWARRLSVAATAIIAAGALGVVPAAAHANWAAGLTRDRAARSARTAPARIATAYTVPYGGGPVLHSNRTHLIFWQPAGSGLTFDPGYQDLIETFMRNVAAASHSTTSVYGLTGQYTDNDGAAAYASTYGGAVTATDKLPAYGCQEPSTGPAGWTVCLTDAQLQHEIEKVVRRRRLPTGPTDIYFLITPNGLGDCEFNGSSSCALGGDAGGYCGYHSQTDDGLLLYAVIPYNAIPGHCQSDNPRPNDSTADPAISTIAHEQIESITDPLGDAWVDGAGDEIADLCLTNFGPPIGGSGMSAWNENINGGHYYLQEVWSNASGRCEPRAKPDSASFQAWKASSRGLSVWFHASADAPQGKIVSYRWNFGDGGRGTGARMIHRFWRTGQYHVVLRTTDSWGNWAFYAATVTVLRAGGRVTVETKSG